MAKIDAFLEILADQKASDLHLISGCQPMIRHHGSIKAIKFRVLTATYTWSLIEEILTQNQKEVFTKNKELDFAYAIPGLARFRVNLFQQRIGISAVFRLIPEEILTLTDLKLPLSLRQFCFMDKGLVLMTGPTGSGKSTTLAALIDVINSERHCHIITIEDPVEFVHPPKQSLITQREIGNDTATFGTALKSALREAADVILIGEMRDLETISLALTCAETGCLVFGTLHTSSAAKTVDRIIDVFPKEAQEQIRMQLSLSLRGVVAQQLLRRKDGHGRVAALEILVGNIALGNLIREGKTFQINSLIQGSDFEKTGMQTLDQALQKLLRDKVVTYDEAHMKAYDKMRFKAFIEASGEDEF